MNYGDKPLEIPPQEGGTPETDRSIRAITEVGLPLLRGTEADITAAHEIRLDKLMAADDLLTGLRVEGQEAKVGHQNAGLPEPPQANNPIRMAQTALNRLRHQDDAAWWLAHCDRSPRELIELFTDGHSLPIPEG